ncbi:sensor domain-containing diguanylate cyclase [Marinithermus hydrothermalis]|uniref:Diguanylate cyclase with GAF sensor n=1 Tax=Marinithermus hydrothermalis (strain DSM 14884 / JCM 11576 / T1) TaxID=869210 RepID=F2NMF6_MARHT|nr:sensor domain-containing diguanylate cyclase [Marinithermus hydrothermalis]AEB11844.1 diguanylate cyclase with GAF sensor [Marinithermus hydrothermalis DSM 14884]
MLKAYLELAKRLNRDADRTAFWAGLLEVTGYEQARVFRTLEGRSVLVEAYPERGPCRSPDPEEACRPLSEGLERERILEVPNPVPGRVQSLLVVPLRSPRGPLGVLELVAETAPHPPLTDAERRGIEYLGQVLAARLEAEQAEAKAQAKQRRLAGLLALARAMNTVHNLRELMLALRQGLASSLNFEIMYLALREGEVFRLFYFEDGETPLVGELTHPVAGAPLTRHVIEHGAPLLLEDLSDPKVQARHKVARYRPAGSGLEGRAYMGVPIRYRTFEGVLSVQSSKPNAFSLEDLEHLTTLAALVELALDRVRWEEREAILQGLARLGVYTARPERFLEALVDLALGCWGAQRGGVWARTPTGYVCRAARGEEADELVDLRLDADLELERALYLDATQPPPPALAQLQERLGGARGVVVPLQARAFQGLLAVGWEEGYTLVDWSVADFLAQEVTPFLEAWSLYQRLEQEAIRDPLTGAYNRRYFRLKAEEMLAQGERYGRRFALLVIDLQNFRDVNNHHGHHVGDQVLARLVAVLNRALRKGDLLCRVGGDEFVLLLPEAGREEARQAALRYAEAVRDDPVLARYNVRVNIGIAVYPEDGEDLETLWQLGDARMYRAKARAEAVEVSDP